MFQGQIIRSTSMCTKTFTCRPCTMWYQNAVPLILLGFKRYTTLNFYHNYEKKNLN